MAIQEIQIATNRYAPDGSSAVNLYSYDYASDLTLPQLIQAICIRSAAACEAQSVTKMNMMTAGSQILTDASALLEQVANGTATWSTARAFCIGQLKIPSASLPAENESISSYEKRMQVAAAMQDKMNALAQTQQEDMIDLQTIVNRRDVAYSTSSGVVRTMGQSQIQDAANFLR